jgi:diguanylate cyclase (GGDEF)-like protein
MRKYGQARIFALRDLRGRPGMFDANSMRQRTMRGLLRPSSAPAAVATILVIVFGIFVDKQSRQLSIEKTRTEILAQITLVRTKLEGDINGDLALVRGLVNIISSEPDMAQPRFAELASGLIEARSQIRAIAAAPNLQISLLYPPEANFEVNGARNDPPRVLAMQARDRLGVVVAGPFALAQGGKGLIARFPVFAKGADGARSFWGIVSAIIDADKLYHDSGLIGGDRAIDVAIFTQNRADGGAATFFGDERVKEDRPVTTDVRLPSGSWRIAATPRGGWDAPQPGDWLLRLAIAAAGLLVVVPTWLIARLVEVRRKQFLMLRDRESDLERLSERLKLALDASKVGAWEFDLNSEKLVWDDRMNELYAYPRDDGARDYRHWRERLDPDDAPRAEQEFLAAIERKERYESQYKLALPNGQSRIIRALGNVYQGPGASAKIVGLNWDVTADVALNADLTRSKAMTEARNAELELARARIEYNALHDFLTKLPNRLYLERVLDERALRCAVTGEGVALLHLDLDRFKHINDTLGHLAGDAMLIHTGALIKACLGDGDFVARTGGDEFVILCNAKTGMEGFAALAQRIIDRVRQPALHEGHECRFGMSIGIAGAFGKDVVRKRLLVNADIALYRAKKLGGNRFELFTEALHVQIIKEKRIADSIMRGLERGEFIPFFQPQFDAHTLQLVGVEALVRWRHPARGILAPSEFLDVAEELGAVGAIDRLVLEQSLEQFHRWRDLDLQVPRFSVNVSLRRLQDESLLDSLRDLDIEPGTLSFELLETIYLDERDEHFLNVIDKIKALGIDIEIDDFGTGYASIVSLTKLRPRRLKIDRQLVIPVVNSRAQQRLVQSIVDIGKSLDIEIVAEGVETMRHARLLRDLGCNILQGYTFAKPMAGDQLEQFISERMRMVVS